MVGGVAAGHEIKSPVGEGEVFGVAQEEGGVADFLCSSASLVTEFQHRLGQVDGNHGGHLR